MARRSRSTAGISPSGPNTPTRPQPHCASQKFPAASKTAPSGFPFSAVRSMNTSGPPVGQPVAVERLAHDPAGRRVGEIGMTAVRREADRVRDGDGA